MVFPGATHTRFEHSVGAVHVAQLIVNHVNHNYRKNTSQIARGDWISGGINFPLARFIRLGALLHDIGHLPFGHTLEDELDHLKSHDGPERLSLVAETRYAEHEVQDGSGLKPLTRPPNGWSLQDLVDALFGSIVDELG